MRYTICRFMFIVYELYVYAMYVILNWDVIVIYVEIKWARYDAVKVSSIN